MISSNHTWLVETVSWCPKTGLPGVPTCICLWVFALLGTNISRGEDFVLIICVHQEGYVFFNGSKQPTGQYFSLWHFICHQAIQFAVGEGRREVVIKNYFPLGHLGTSMMEIHHPEHHHMLWQRKDRPGNDIGHFLASVKNDQHQLYSLFLARVNNMSSLHCKGINCLLFTQEERELEIEKTGEVNLFPSRQMPPYAEGLGWDPRVLGYAYSVQPLTGRCALIHLHILAYPPTIPTFRPSKEEWGWCLEEQLQCHIPLCVVCVHVRVLTQDIIDASGLSCIQPGLWRQQKPFPPLLFLITIAFCRTDLAQLSAWNPKKDFEQADQRKGELPRWTFPVFMAMGILDGNPLMLEPQMAMKIPPTHLDA